MKAKMTRRALLMSVVSMLLCVSMLIGTTFAWFTDSVASANNIIKAGNLDVELYYQVEGQSDWKKVTETTNVFMENSLWEPGHTEVVKLKVVNEGALALKYQLGVNIASETGSKDATGKEFMLSDYIKFGIVDGEQTYTREQAVAAVDATATALKTAYSSKTIELLPKTDDNTAEEVYTDIVTVVVYMPTSVGNEANHGKGEAVPTINLGINLFATQFAYEEDSFNNEYDAEAAYTLHISSAEEFIAVLTDIRARAKQQIPGATGNKNYREYVNFVLENDIVIDANTEFMYTDGNGAPLHFYGVKGVIDLNGHNIIVNADALLAGKSYANAALLVQYSNIDIVGDGSIITNNKSIPVYGWANGSVNIYGGTYITNASERNESAVYVNNPSMVINVYGGNYEGSAYAFNAHDNCGNTPVIVLHEGVLYKNFLKNNTTDVIASDMNAGRIQLEDDCYLAQQQINGETWYEITKKSATASYISSVDDMREAMKTPNAKIVLTDDLVINDDKGTGYALYAKYDVTIDLNGKNLKVDLPDKVFNGIIYALNGAKVNIVGDGNIEINGGVGQFIWCTGANGATEVNIYGGHWTQNSEDFTTVNSNYCEGIYANREGKINIYGGTFNWKNFEKYTLNESRGGVVTVFGGTFINFDPSVSSDSDGSYVAAGYKVISKTQANGDIWYIVLPE